MSETGAGDDAGPGDEPRDDTAPDGDLEDPFGELQGEDEFYELPDDDEPHTALPSKVESWRRRSATGAILTGFALGLQEVFEPKRDEPAVVMETSGDPPRDLPVEADFEYGRPRQSVVNVRPWLLPDAPTSNSEAPNSELPNSRPADPESSTGGQHGDGEEHQA